MERSEITPGTGRITKENAPPEWLLLLLLVKHGIISRRRGENLCKLTLEQLRVCVKMEVNDFDGKVPHKDNIEILKLMGDFPGAE